MIKYWSLSFYKTYPHKTNVQVGTLLLAENCLEYIAPIILIGPCRR